MTKVFIDGAAGTTGIQIRDRLAGRSEFTLIELDDAARKDDGARAGAINGADIVILCLPDDAARAAVGMIANDTTRVIDASTAHRTAPDWIFGLPGDLRPSCRRERAVRVQSGLLFHRLHRARRAVGGTRPCRARYAPVLQCRLGLFGRWQVDDRRI